MAAILAYAPKELPQTCARCKIPEEADTRKAWGCDAEQPDPVQWIGCVECDGHDQDCAHCFGSGQTALYRCPWATVQANPNLFECVRYANLVETGILPSGGGLRDQAAVFVDGMTRVLKDKAKIEEELRRRQKQ